MIWWTMKKRQPNENFNLWKGKSGVLSLNVQCWNAKQTLKFSGKCFVEKGKNYVESPTKWTYKFGEVTMKDRKVLNNWKNHLAVFCLCECSRVKKMYRFIMLPSNNPTALKKSCKFSLAILIFVKPLNVSSRNIFFPLKIVSIGCINLWNDSCVQQNKKS